MFFLSGSPKFCFGHLKLPVTEQYGHQFPKMNGSPVLISSANSAIETGEKERAG